jgi:hypothetical protein
MFFNVEFILHMKLHETTSTYFFQDVPGVFVFSGPIYVSDFDPNIHRVEMPTPALSKVSPNYTKVVKGEGMPSKSAAEKAEIRTFLRWDGPRMFQGCHWVVEMIGMITAVESRLDVGEEQVRTHAVVDPTKQNINQEARMFGCNLETIWLVVWNMFLFFHILGIIIPTDFHIFQRVGEKPPTSYRYGVSTARPWRQQGDLIITFDIIYPKALSEDQKVHRHLFGKKCGENPHFW